MADSEPTAAEETGQMSEQAVAEAPPEEKAEKKKRGRPRKHHAAEAAENTPAPNAPDGHIRTLKVGSRKFQIPYVDLIDPLSDEEYKELKADIKERGIVDPVTLLEIKGEPHIVIDGHNRLTIAAELQIPLKDIPFHYLDDKKVSREEAEEDAVRFNFQRRKNTPERRAHMAHKLSSAPHNYSARRIGRVLGCDHTTILGYLETPDPLAPVEGEEAVNGEAQTDRVVGQDNRTYKRKRKAVKPAQSREERSEAVKTKKARKAAMKACKILARMLGHLGIEHQQTEKAKFGAIVQEIYDTAEAFKPEA